MSLKDRFAERPAVKPRFVQQLEALPAEEYEALVEAARDSSWSGAAIVRALNDEGIRVGKDAFLKWRNSVAR